MSRAIKIVFGLGAIALLALSLARPLLQRNAEATSSASLSVESLKRASTAIRFTKISIPPWIVADSDKPASRAADLLEVAAGLRMIERLRRLPGAAALVDDIVAYLKTDRADSVSLDNIPTDEHGLALLSEKTAAQLVGDSEISKKWELLAELASRHPERLAPGKDQ